MLDVQVFVIVMLALSGCARPAARAGGREVAVPSRAAPVSTIRVHDALPWPYRLERIGVWVDGVLLYRSATPPAREPIARLELAPGDHSILAEALASYRTTLFGAQSCPVRLTAHEGLRVGPAPARIEVKLRVRGIAREFSERLTLSVGAQGATRVAHRAVPHESYDAALPDSPAATLEALQARLERAREAGDVVQMICYDSKVNDVQTLLRMRERRRELLANDPGNAAYHRDMIAVVDGAIGRVYGASNPCTGEKGGYVNALLQGPDLWAPACTATLED